jgi:hypothetical protein
VAVAESSKSLPAEQPIALPPVLSEERRTDGFRSRMWGVRKLKPGEEVPVKWALAHLEMRDVPTTSTQIDWHIGRLLSHWDNSRTTAAVQNEQLADWEIDLAPYAEAHIAEACAIWRRTQVFKPKIAEIITLVENFQFRDRENARRCRVLLGLQEPRSFERIPPASKNSPADPSKAAAIMEKLSALFPSRRKPEPAPRVPIDRSAIKKDLDSRDPVAVEKLRAFRPAAAPAEKNP